MLIAKAEILLTEPPYKPPYQTATNITPKGRHIVLKLTTATGLVGWGEYGIISRRYPAQGDTPETMLAVLESYLCPAIIGYSFVHTAKLHLTANSRDRNCYHWVDPLYLNE